MPLKVQCSLPSIGLKLYHQGVHTREKKIAQSGHTIPTEHNNILLIPKTTMSTTTRHNGVTLPTYNRRKKVLVLPVVIILGKTIQK